MKNRWAEYDRSSVKESACHLRLKQKIDEEELENGNQKAHTHSAADTREGIQ